jgi:hypothetical protein
MFGVHRVGRIMSVARVALFCILFVASDQVSVAQSGGPKRDVCRAALAELKEQRPALRQTLARLLQWAS